METIIGKLMDHPGGLTSKHDQALVRRVVELKCVATVKDMVALPDLPQPRVNKCLIALVTKKIVSKLSVGVSRVLC